MDKERKTEYANTNQDKVEVETSLSDRADFGQRATWDKEG